MDTIVEDVEPEAVKVWLVNRIGVSVVFSDIVVEIIEVEFIACVDKEELVATFTGVNVEFSDVAVELIIAEVVWFIDGVTEE